MVWNVQEWINTTARSQAVRRHLFSVRARETRSASWTETEEPASTTYTGLQDIAVRNHTTGIRTLLGVR